MQSSAGHRIIADVRGGVAQCPFENGVINEMIMLEVSEKATQGSDAFDDSGASAFRMAAGHPVRVEGTPAAKLTSLATCSALLASSPVSQSSARKTEVSISNPTQLQLDLSIRLTASHDKGEAVELPAQSVTLVPKESPHSLSFRMQLQVVCPLHRMLVRNEAHFLIENGFSKRTIYSDGKVQHNCAYGDLNGRNVAHHWNELVD